MAAFKKVSLLVVFSLFVAVSPVRAAYIDFLSSYWQPAGNQTSLSRYVADLDVDIMVTATGGTGYLYWDSVDGFGVKGGENDEVDKAETLTFTFSSPVNLWSFGLTDLFTEYNYREQGYYSLNGGSGIGFLADLSQTPGGTNGIKLVTLGGPSVNSITFYALNPVPDGQHHDFSVANLRAERVVPQQTPEPGTIILFTSALAAGLAGRRRFFRK